MINRLQQAEKFFKGTQYEALVTEAWESYQIGNTVQAESLMLKLPTPEQLLVRLVDKLKDKPVYKTLKLIAEGKADSDEIRLKGLFSLGTHTIIEIEQGGKEYRSLLPLIYERIGEVVCLV